MANKTVKLDDYIKEQLKDPEFARYYHEAGEKLDTAVALYKNREAAGLTQADLAEKSGVSLSTIARIERGENVSFDTYWKLAWAMGKQVKIDFV